MSLPDEKTWYWGEKARQEYMASRRIDAQAEKADHSKPLTHSHGRPDKGKLLHAHPGWSQSIIWDSVGVTMHTHRPIEKAEPEEKVERYRVGTVDFTDRRSSTGLFIRKYEDGSEDIELPTPENEKEFATAPVYSELHFHKIGTGWRLIKEHRGPYGPSPDCHPRRCAVVVVDIKTAYFLEKDDYVEIDASAFKRWA